MPSKLPRRKKGSGVLRKKRTHNGPAPKALEISDGRCIARVKTCSKCQYRYIRGDKAWVCPKCGTDRRCPNRAAKGNPVCRMHGANLDGALASAKYNVAHQIYEGYNRLINDPNLLNLTQEIAVVGARSDELFGMLNAVDSRGAHESIGRALQSLETVVFMAMQDRGKNKVLEIPMADLQGVIRKFHEALSPVNIEFHLWDMLKDSLEMTRRLQDTERKWAVSNEGLIPVQLVLEVLLTIQRLTMKYIRNPEDRAAFGKEFRDAIPVEAVAKV
jgi:hypothetical protein